MVICSVQITGGAFAHHAEDHGKALHPVLHLGKLGLQRRKLGVLINATFWDPLIEDIFAPPPNMRRNEEECVLPARILSPSHDLQKDSLQSVLRALVLTSLITPMNNGADCTVQMLATGMLSNTCS